LKSIYLGSKINLLKLLHKKLNSNLLKIAFISICSHEIAQIPSFPPFLQSEEDSFSQAEEIFNTTFFDLSKKIPKEIFQIWLFKNFRFQKKFYQKIRFQEIFEAFPPSPVF